MIAVFSHLVSFAPCHGQPAKGGIIKANCGLAGLFLLQKYTYVGGQFLSEIFSCAPPLILHLPCHFGAIYWNNFLRVLTESGDAPFHSSNNILLCLIKASVPSQLSPVFIPSRVSTWQESASRRSNYPHAVFVFWLIANQIWDLVRDDRDAAKNARVWRFGTQSRLRTH